MDILGSLFLVIFGLIMILSPMKVWKIAYSWKTKNKAEPSDYYLIMIRIGGLVLLAGGLAAAWEMFPGL